jgi:hypothetical protein
MDRLNPVTGSVGFDVDVFPVLAPPAPGPDPAPVYGPLRTQGGHFYAGAARWRWKGATDFRLAQRVYHGEDIRPLMAQRKAAGANLLRVAAMKANNTGWAFDPRDDPGRYWSAVETCWAMAREHQLYLEWSVFLDTALLGMGEPWQLDFWAKTVERAQQYDHILLELMNEDGHPTQDVDPLAFPRPSGVLASRGSGLTDADVVRPTWDFATYHSRRDPPPDTRGFTNYDPYEFQAVYPKACPFIPDEGMKPHHYGYDPTVAALMGAHAGMADGGCFHTDINSDPWTPEIAACARAFYAAIP